MESDVLYSVSDGVATVTLNRPDRLNALLPEMTDRMVERVEQADRDNAVRVIVLTGAGRAFSSGADMQRMGEPGRLGRSALVGRERNLHGAGVVERLLRREKPLIAAVNGVVAGMACSYVLASDFALASTNAAFAFRFVRVGFVPDCGSTWLLPRRVGLAQAQRLVLTGEKIDAAEALRLGLVSEVIEEDGFRGRVRELTRTIAANPPLAVRLARSLLERSAKSDFRTAVEAESLTQGVLGETEDHKEAVRAFLERRQPIFQGK